MDQYKDLETYLETQKPSKFTKWIDVIKLDIYEHFAAKAEEQRYKINYPNMYACDMLVFKVHNYADKCTAKKKITTSDLTSLILFKSLLLEVKKKYPDKFDIEINVIVEKISVLVPEELNNSIKDIDKMIDMLSKKIGVDLSTSGTFTGLETC